MATAAGWIVGGLAGLGVFALMVSLGIQPKQGSPWAFALLYLAGLVWVIVGEHVRRVILRYLIKGDD